MEPAIISNAQDTEADYYIKRVELVERILKALKRYEQGTPLPPLGELIWSCLWLSDIEALDRITSKFESDPRPAFSYVQGVLLGSRLRALWTGRRSASFTLKSRPSTPTFSTAQTEPDDANLNPLPEGPSRKRKRVESSSSLAGLTAPQFSRSKNMAELCRKRDKTCVLTKATEPNNVSHIIPYSLSARSPSQLRDFWELLSFFWDASKISQIQQYIKEKSTETIGNYLLLAPHVHVYWDAQLFALKPLVMSDDKKSLTVEFCWLCPENVDSVQLTTAALPADGQKFTVKPPSFPANLGQGGRKCSHSERPNLRIYNSETNEQIVSGQIITLTTEDPENMPLPDPLLLSLQWTLHRVFALASAAGYKEDENGDYEEDEDDRLWREPAIFSEEEEEEEDVLDGYEEPRAKELSANHAPANVLGVG
ncbi:hypothetical protein ACJ72_04763 [Emergomyces africanus]|uniref:HNH nuclease domain-containing protein n=1 Tax=Emergomyces africanus TaxID=1955775 RepID=A0A1B7NVV4_9EURO|nr:hypothetical protein ACJ72_04763 [Emergomyces africanus]